MNALALFWVTDSISERSAGGPPSGPNVTLDYAIDEMSERSSRPKGPRMSADGMIPADHRHSHHSSSLLVALDRGFRMLFVREQVPRDTATVDLEVSPYSIGPLHNHQGRKPQITIHTETNVDISAPREASQAHTKKGKAKAIRFL